MFGRRKELPITDIRREYPSHKLQRADPLLQYCVTLSEADQAMAGGVFKLAVLGNVIEPAHVEWLYRDCKYLWSIIAGHISNKYGNDRKSALCSKLLVTNEDLFDHYQKRDLPLWIILDAVLFYESVIMKDFENFTMAKVHSEKFSFKKNKLSEAVELACKK